VSGRQSRGGGLRGCYRPRRCPGRLHPRVLLGPAWLRGGHELHWPSGRRCPRTTCRGAWISSRCRSTMHLRQLLCTSAGCRAAHTSAQEGQLCRQRPVLVLQELHLKLQHSALGGVESLVRRGRGSHGLVLCPARCSRRQLLRRFSGQPVVASSSASLCGTSGAVASALSKTGLPALLRQHTTLRGRARAGPAAATDVVNVLHVDILGARYGNHERLPAASQLLHPLVQSLLYVGG